jgi:hypothetical protein
MATSAHVTFVPRSKTVVVNWDSSHDERLDDDDWPLTGFASVERLPIGVASVAADYTVTVSHRRHTLHGTACPEHVAAWHVWGGVGLERNEVKCIQLAVL